MDTVKVSSNPGFTLSPGRREGSLRSRPGVGAVCHSCGSRKPDCFVHASVFLLGKRKLRDIFWVPAFVGMTYGSRGVELDHWAAVACLPAPMLLKVSAYGSSQIVETAKIPCFPPPWVSLGFANIHRIAAGRARQACPSIRQNVRYAERRDMLGILVLIF